MSIIINKKLGMVFLAVALFLFMGFAFAEIDGIKIISELRSFNISHTPPNITLLSPANNTLNITSKVVIFEYNVSDNAEVSNCSLIINNTINITNRSILTYTMNSFNQTLNDGNHSWSINCTDIGGKVGNSTTFNITIQVNDTPVIVNMTVLAAQNPTDNGKTLIKFNFTVNDLDGVETLNHSRALVRFAKNASVRSGLCSNNTLTSTITEYNCTVDMWYFDDAGTWKINVSIADKDNLSTYNESTSFTYNELNAITLASASVAFSGNAGDVNLESAAPQIINNTGNFNFTMINITGYELNYSTFKIGGGNFTVNVTKNSLGYGQKIVNASGIVLINPGGLNVTLPKGNNSNRSIYMMLDIPIAVASGTYSSAASWSIEVK